MTRTASRSAREGGTWASPSMARSTLLVFLAAFMPVAEAWRVGDAAPGFGPSGGRPGLRGKGTATPAFQLLPSMGMGHLAGARRQGISLAPPPRLKMPKLRQGRFHLAPFGGRAMRMAEQPSTPQMEQLSVSVLDGVAEKMSSGQVSLPCAIHLTDLHSSSYETLPHSG